MNQIEKFRRKIQKTCAHPEIAGSGHDEGPSGFGYVTWQCNECEADITASTNLKKGTILSFWSRARLTRDCKFGEIRPKDQEFIK